MVAAWAARPFNAALLLALILMGFYHAALGLQVVLEDYVDGAALRTASILAVKGACLLLALMAALAAVKLFLAAH